MRIYILYTYVYDFMCIYTHIIYVRYTYMYIHVYHVDVCYVYTYIYVYIGVYMFQHLACYNFYVTSINTVGFLAKFYCICLKNKCMKYKYMAHTHKCDTYTHI